MLKVVVPALFLGLGAAACNGILGNTEASGTDDHLFDPAVTDAAIDTSVGDASGSFDALIESDLADAPGADTGSDAGADAASLACGAPAFVNSCLDCPGKMMLCDGGCVATCHGGCGVGAGSAPVECIACDATGKRDIAVCESPTNGGACLAGHSRCPCTATGVADCFGPVQVCIGGSCYACGENATDGVDCKVGGTCSNQGSGFNRYTCN